MERVAAGARTMRDRDGVRTRASIDNASVLDALQTTYETTYEGIFGADQAPQTLSSFFAEVIDVNSLRIELDMFGAFPAFRKWIGARVFETIRAYQQIVTLETYESTFRVERKQVQYDKAGLLARGIAQWLQASSYIYDQIAVDTILANPVGYDGVALISASHPHGPAGANQSNLTTDALGHESYRAMKAQLAKLQTERSQPFYRSYDVLLVGPDQERIALEVTGAQRPVNVTNAGALDGTANVVGLTAIPNVYQGTATVVVHPRLRGLQWFMVSRSMGVAPIVIFQGEAPVRQQVTLDDDGVPVFVNDEYWYGLRADLVGAAGAWQNIGGRIAS